MIFLGLDIGYSKRKPSVGICIITIFEKSLFWSVRHVRQDVFIETIRELVPGNERITAAGIDGPLASQLQPIQECRSAERVLSLGKFQSPKYCCPASTKGAGQKLHKETTEMTQKLRCEFVLTSSLTAPRITNENVFEAFPTAFLGMLLSDEQWDEPLQKLESMNKNKRGKRTDVLWEACIERELLQKASEAVFGDVLYDKSIKEITNHDERAAFICALTAAGRHKNKYCAVGDYERGYIFLPPFEVWADWAREAVNENAERILTPIELWRDSCLVQQFPAEEVAEL